VLCVCLVCVCAFAHTCARTCACATMREFASVVLQSSFVFKCVYAFLHTHTYRCCPPTSYILTQSSTHALFLSLTHTLFPSLTLSLSVSRAHTHTHTGETAEARRSNKRRFCHPCPASSESYWPLPLQVHFLC